MRKKKYTKNQVKRSIISYQIPHTTSHHTNYPINTKQKKSDIKAKQAVTKLIKKEITPEL